MRYSCFLVILALSLAGTFRVQAGVPGHGPHGPDRMPGRPVAKRVTGGTGPVQAIFGWSTWTNCLPIDMQFVDSSTTSGTNIIDWSWDFGDGYTDSGQYPVHDYLVDGNYTVSLTVTDDVGNTSTATKVVAIDTHTPVVTLGPDTSACAPVILDAGPQPPDCQYIWSTGETTRTIMVTTTDDYSVQVYNATCHGDASLHVTFRPQLTVGFVYGQLGVCLPVSVQLTDTSESCGAYVVHRRWDFDNGDSSLQQNPVHAYNTGGSHTVTLTERDNTGMEKVSTQTVYVNINSIPVNLGNDTTLCYGNPLILDAGNPASQYHWSTGDTTRTIQLINPGTYSVQVSNNGCIGWDTLVVTTIFPLAPGFSSTITSQCLPVLVNFADLTQTLCGVSPITSWKWDFGDSTFSQQQNPSHIYNKAGKFTVKLTVRDSLSVSATATRDINIITIGPDPVYLHSSTICPGTTVQLDAGNDSARFIWTPSGLLSSDTISTPQAAPGVTTLFKVTVSKCGVTIVDSVMIYVDSVTRPFIQYDGGSLTSQAAVSYQWYKDSVKIAGATGRSYKPLVAGYYQVEVSNARGCYGRSAGYFFLPDGVAIPGSKMKVKVSPNPSSGKIVHVLFSRMPGQTVEINMYDAYGRKMYGGNCHSNVNTIDCSRMDKGQYFIEVITNGQRAVLPVQLL